MLRAFLLASLFAFHPLALAGKVYRCEDGSYQDKPCGHGERVVTNNNRQAAAPAGANKPCFERGQAAYRLAKRKETNTPIEKIVESIEQSAKPYAQQLEEKTFAVKVYQSKGSPVEVKTLFESECVAQMQETAKAPAAAVPAATAPPPTPVAPQTAQSAEMEKLCKKLQSDKKAAKPTMVTPGDDMQDLMDQHKLMQEQLRDLCS